MAVHETGRSSGGSPRMWLLNAADLWLVNQLCDLVQIRSSEVGSVVRIRVGPE